MKGYVGTPYCATPYIIYDNALKERQKLEKEKESLTVLVLCPNRWNVYQNKYWKVQNVRA